MAAAAAPVPVRPVATHSPVPVCPVATHSPSYCYVHQGDCGSFALALDTAGSPWQQGDGERLDVLHQVPSNGTQIRELLSLVLTFSRVSASSLVKGNIYLCKKV